MGDGQSTEYGAPVMRLEPHQDVLIGAGAIVLRVRRVDRLTWLTWLRDCPPRQGHDEPVDWSTFVMHAAKGSATYVDVDGEEHEIAADEWAKIDARLTDGEYAGLAKAVLSVNGAVWRSPDRRNPSE